MDPIFLLLLNKFQRQVGREALGSELWWGHNPGLEIPNWQRFDSHLAPDATLHCLLTLPGLPGPFPRCRMWQDPRLSTRPTWHFAVTGWVASNSRGHICALPQDFWIKGSPPGTPRSLLCHRAVCPIHSLVASALGPITQGLSPVPRGWYEAHYLQVPISVTSQATRSPRVTEPWPPFL